MQLTSIAIRVHDLEAMARFYGEVFGGRFEDVDVGHGLRAKFGQVAGVRFKLVALRDAPDPEGYPVHQLELAVQDVPGVVAAAEALGGRREGDPTPERGCVRDPDGNTIELVRR